MKIAVTGASGRVGTAVVDRALAEGHDVVAIDRVPARRAANSIATVELDLQDYEAVVRALSGCDALIHLAAITGPGRHPDHVVHDNNVMSSYHALLGAAEAGLRRVCQASSVNAIGGRFSHAARYDYFPVDERHPAYFEDPYSLSKWICEQQADALTRRHPDVSVASLRLHGVVDRRADATVWIDTLAEGVVRQLWGYTETEAAARAFLAGVTADVNGHEALYIVAPDTMVETPSIELAQRYYPEVPVTGDLSGRRGFFDCSRAELVLGWRHDEETKSATAKSATVEP